MISTEHQAIFLHAPKTAGSSISYALSRGILKPGDNEEQYKALHTELDKQSPGLPHHASLEEVSDYMASKGQSEQFESFFKFTFVRNPFDQLYSFFMFHKYWLAEKGIVSVFRFEEEFEGFLCGLDGGALSLNQINNQSERGVENAQAVFREIFQKQYAYIDGKINVDFVGKFESLKRDFNVVSKALGIPSDLPHKKRASPSLERQPYWAHYSEKSRKIAEALLREDLETFNYCF